MKSIISVAANVFISGEFLSSPKYSKLFPKHSTTTITISELVNISTIINPLYSTTTYREWETYLSY